MLQEKPRFTSPPLNNWYHIFCSFPFFYNLFCEGRAVFSFYPTLFEPLAASYPENNIMHFALKKKADITFGFFKKSHTQIFSFQTAEELFCAQT